MPKKVRKNFRLSKEAVKILERLKRTLGLSETAIVEVSLRHLASAENLTESIRNLTEFS